MRSAHILYPVNVNAIDVKKKSSTIRMYVPAYNLFYNYVKCILHFFFFSVWPALIIG